MTIRTEVRSTWQRLNEWAQENSPAMCSRLQGPATDEALARFEEETGLAIPAGLLASLQCHNGESRSGESYVWSDRGQLLSVEDMLKAWRSLLTIAEEPDPEEIAESISDNLIEVDGPVWAVSHHSSWIPFIEMNGGDETCYLDLAPTPGGTEGQVISVDREVGRWAVEAKSFEAFFADYVAALEAGEYSERDEGGLPTAYGEDDAEAKGAGATELNRINKVVESSTPLQELTRLKAGSEAGVAGVVFESSAKKTRHEMSIWGGSIRLRGDLGKNPQKHDLLVVRVRVPTKKSGKETIFEVVSWKAEA